MPPSAWHTRMRWTISGGQSQAQARASSTVTAQAAFLIGNDARTSSRPLYTKGYDQAASTRLLVCPLVCKRGGLSACSCTLICNSSTSRCLSKWYTICLGYGITKMPQHGFGMPPLVSRSTRSGRTLLPSPAPPPLLACAGSLLEPDRNDRLHARLHASSCPPPSTTWT